MDLWKVIKTRRSVRQFMKKPVPDNVLNKVLSAATVAPSACNEQNWKFVVVRNKETLKRMVQDCGLSRLVLNAPLTVFVFYYKSPYPQNIQSASAAVQNILLAATNEGLGSLWIGGSGSYSKIKNILQVPDDFDLICQVLLGYSNQTKRSPSRKPLSEIVYHEKFIGENIVTSHNPDKWTLDQIKNHQRFFCSKTTPGTKMMVTSNQERHLIKDILRKHTSGKIVDFFSYDGSLLDCFPVKPLSVDLSKETMNYVKTLKKSKPILINDKIPSASLVTLIFKLESIPKKEYRNLFTKIAQILDKNGKLIIISRKTNSLYSFIHKLVIKSFKDDVRKSGIFSFFGPYYPINVNKLPLDKFKVRSKNYFFIPPILEQYYYLYKQYKVGGNTYLDSVKKGTLIAKFLRSLAKLTKNFPFGSINVTIAEKI